MIKLLAVDMDGTCLDRRSRMTDATLEALRKAAGRGVIIVPTTGRNLECIPHRLAAGTLFTTGAMDEKKNRDLFRYVISSNGACVTDIRERKEIFRAPVPADDVLPLLRECGKLRLGIASHIRHRYLLEGRFLTMAGRLVYGKDARGVCCVRSMEEFIRKGGYKVEEFQFYFFSPGAEQDVRSVLEKYPDLRAAYTGIYVEVYSKDASKGRALAELARHLNIRKEEIACIGDGENDLSMFEAAGLRIAMGNAVEDLKKQADHVTDSNARDGAAKAVEWILKR
ncbi:MAG TPA: HAD-IIB family hydrolase [Candidatus Mediterraneibacter intestinigallinarum]|nr:HAD-IIB family hydrolase [Candidatus Mediterraneibacter intestinigallinarum]